MQTFGEEEFYVPGNLTVKGRIIPCSQEKDLELTKYALSQISVLTSKIEFLEQRMFGVERVISEELQLDLSSEGSSKEL